MHVENNSQKVLLTHSLQGININRDFFGVFLYNVSYIYNILIYIDTRTYTHVCAHIFFKSSNIVLYYTPYLHPDYFI